MEPSMLVASTLSLVGQRLDQQRLAELEQQPRSHGSDARCQQLQQLCEPAVQQALPAIVEKEGCVGRHQAHQVQRQQAEGDEAQRHQPEAGPSLPAQPGDEVGKSDHHPLLNKTRPHSVASLRCAILQGSGEASMKNKALKAWLAAGLLMSGGLAHAQASAGADADWSYRVQKGDTLITLTRSWLAAPRTWRDLQKLNRVGDPRRLQPGRLLRMPVAWLKQEASVAEAVFVKGDVQRQRGTASEALTSGSSLLSGDRVRTGAQSSASLRFVDGSRLLVPPESDVALDQLLVLGRGALPAVRLRLTKGGADNRVAPNAQRVPLYELRTPHANLGVRGTEFRVQVEGAATRMQVLSGAVHADGRAGDVGGGEGLLAEGTALSVAPLLPAPDLSALPRTAERLPLRLGWTASPPGAVAWRAQLYAKGDFDRLLLDARVTDPQAAWAEARELADGDYTLRLRGIDARGQEGASADAELSLQARPEPPFVQAPAQGAVSYTGGMALSWTRNTAAPGVRLQVARDAGFKDLALQPGPIDAATYEVRLPDGAYHWRIAAVEAGGDAPVIGTVGKSDFIRGGVDGPR
ncbi:MAG: hypothetical protein EOP39_20025, partial [Rubrivivax sp.]